MDGATTTAGTYAHPNTEMSAYHHERRQRTKMTENKKETTPQIPMEIIYRWVECNLVRSPMSSMIPQVFNPHNNGMEPKQKQISRIIGHSPRQSIILKFCFIVTSVVTMSTTPEFIACVYR